jgi:peptidoglycan/LPS O-acetylase OafA/YrhL
VNATNRSPSAWLRRSDSNRPGSVSSGTGQRLGERPVGGIETLTSVGEEPTEGAERDEPTNQSAACARHAAEATCLLVGNGRPYRFFLVNHQPALDGLRGVAVAGVVAFHAGASWAVGGYLGVSLFFTLSGFLITSLLLHEGDRTGRIDLGAFWARRARRLLPASLLTLFAVAAVASVAGTGDQLADLRGDVWSALLYVANWRFILGGQSYGDLFAAPSPLLHFWSLAIEEQLYVVFPLLVFVVGPVRRRLVPVLLGLVALSLALAWTLYEPGGSTSAAYYGTFVRGGELFVGSLLAVLVTSGRQIWRPQVTRAMGVVAAALVALWWTSVRQDDLVLYRGGLLVHAALCAVVILAAIEDDGPVRRVLSWSPLQALGRISYGVYLFHWPILVWWDAPLVAQLGVTIALASLSYALFEQPIRRREWTVPLVAVPSAAALVAVVVVASTLHPPKQESFELAMLPSSAALEIDDSLKGPPPSRRIDGIPVIVKPYVPPPPPPKVAVFGDSTALRTAYGLRGWGWKTGRINMRDGAARVGCPLGRGGIVDWVVAEVAAEPHCDNWPDDWKQIAIDEDLDAAMVQIGPWDVTDRKIDGKWTHIGELDYDEWLETEMHLAVTALAQGGTKVIWLTSPYIDFGRELEGIDHDHPISDRARMDRLNELIHQVDAARDEMVVLDLVEYLRAQPGGEMDPDLRPDGTHFSEDAAVRLATEWLGPTLIGLARD